MMGKREEAARALYEFDVRDAERVQPIAWRNLEDFRKQEYREQFDVVRACIREPDEKMCDAPLEAMPEHANWLNARASFFVWQAMIDAIGD